MKTLKQKIILVDQDGVLANYTKAHLEAIAREFPELPCYHAEEVPHFDTEEIFPSEYHPRIEALVLRPGFFLKLEPIPGAIEAMKDMLRAGHDVRICTAPKKVFDHCVAEKFAWIKRYLGQTFVERIVMTRDKTLVHGDVLIDDKPEVNGVREPLWQHILYDAPYNRDIDRPRLTWANYQEVLEL